MTTKVCLKCLKAKIKETDFYRQNGQFRNVCKDCQYTKRPRINPKDSAYKYLYDICKNAAKFRNLSFELTPQQHRHIIAKNCFHCGNDPIKYNPYVKQAQRTKVSKLRLEQGWIYKNGVDRIDSNQGYSLSNCVPCCAQCNYGKQDYTMEEFIAHCYRIVSFQEYKKC